MRERSVAKVALERTHVHVAPVVHDEARALDKGPITVRNAAHEVCHHPVLLFVVNSQLRVRAGWHGL